ncbi:hypothetical protein [Abyssalbus ytuae]|uniref:Uncharacterized protein n=1 Tax=Abyssalbus ytuae TaxID=2926907 RepID=A0A9E6ZJY7_9FLAO|nr:hypothetical protein [Abyssalbus ytuae]UOB17027.1 hypothetical protein MQE35_14965 [Abyssalbus ytuae]
MKTAIQIVLWLLSIFFAYMIYKSISEPIVFDKIKKERYRDVISRLKDIRDVQEAHRVIKGKYESNFDKLIKFIENEKFVITQQRDSSYMEYDKTYRIDMLKEVRIIDTLGFVSVKDSLFGDSDRYKRLMYVPHAKDDTKFEMKADIINNNGFRVPVFEAKVAKDVILYDQPSDLKERENALISVDEVNGTEIIVGSLTDVSTSGNWPQIYDTKQRK